MRFASALPLVLALGLASCSRTQQATLDSIEPLPDGSGALVVEVQGLRNADGSLYVSLYNNADGFPDDTAGILRSATMRLANDRARVIRFDGLAYGHYAVSILHDENDNGAMDKGLLGVPSEGFGFSNNPRIGFGAPSFESCRFRFDVSEVRLRVSVRYF